MTMAMTSKSTYLSWAWRACGSLPHLTALLLAHFPIIVGPLTRAPPLWGPFLRSVCFSIRPIPVPPTSPAPGTTQPGKGTDATKVNGRSTAGPLPWKSLEWVLIPSHPPRPQAPPPSMQRDPGR
ncbi:hypothetical protein LA080_011096 [Diaporthe eres]|nr:hypothetical protein LA080_011096 [Diaporthe eres]